MGYNSDSELAAHKTGRIALLCGTLAFLGFFVFLVRIDACSSKPESCKEEFFEIQKDTGYNNHSCNVGAVIETVSSPPAPKAGLLCHCPGFKNLTPAPTEPPAHTN